MSGSEPPEAGDNAGGGANTSELVAAIQSDFRVLIAALDQQMQLQEDPDSNVLAALWRVKAAAERGFQLSKRLGNLIENGEKER